MYIIIRIKTQIEECESGRIQLITILNNRDFLRQVNGSRVIKDLCQGFRIVYVGIHSEYSNSIQGLQGIGISRVCIYNQSCGCEQAD